MYETNVKLRKAKVIRAGVSFGRGVCACASAVCACRVLCVRTPRERMLVCATGGRHMASRSLDRTRRRGGRPSHISHSRFMFFLGPSSHVNHFPLGGGGEVGESNHASWTMGAVSTWRRAIPSRMPKISVPVRVSVSQSCPSGHTARPLLDRLID